MKIEYGSDVKPVLEIVMPHPAFAKIGHKPYVSFAMLGALEDIGPIRDWCSNNFALPHRIGNQPIYDCDKQYVIGYTVQIWGEVEDLLLLTLSQ